MATGIGSECRLSPATRARAARVLAGEWGLAMQPASFTLPAAETEQLSPDLHAAKAIRLIAEHAPLRVVEGEVLAGAATLLEATKHQIPLTPFPSVSHTTIGFEKALAIGYDGIRQQVQQRLAADGLDGRGRDLLGAMLLCLEAADVWHGRHVAEVERRVAGSAGAERAEWQAMLDALRPVPAQPPATFRQALQALWMLWDFNRLCGNWSGIGRIDLMLGPFLERDLKSGLVTLDEAREWVAAFWIKGCEWIGCDRFAAGSGDAQFYQNVVLSGVDADGRDVTNTLTYLVLDVVEELHISDFPVAVRLNPATPERLLRRIAEVQRRGGGIVAIYNEPLILDALQHFGYPIEEARRFANDGCWEIIIPGKTAFSYAPFDTLELLQEVIGLGGSPTCEAADFEALYAAFRSRLEARVQEIAGRRVFREGPPAPLLSLLVEGCIEKGRGYNDRGPVYTVLAPHAGGVPDTANSLLVIRTLVYEEQRLSLQELVSVLQSDWQGHEPLRQEVARRFRLYGNDDPAADAMVRRIYDDFTASAAARRMTDGVLHPAGISTFGREIAFREHRLATAFGRHRGEILATNFAPTPGTDMLGPTAVIRSFCGMDYRKLPNGVPLELKMTPAVVRDDAGLSALVALMRAFVKLGGVFLHIDVVSTALLRDAQAHPEEYPNLSVRISGWSARFATLDRRWQEMIINRTEQGHPA